MDFVPYIFAILDYKFVLFITTLFDGLLAIASISRRVRRELSERALIFLPS